MSRSRSQGTEVTIVTGAFSVDKTKTIMFTRKRGINTEIKIYGQTNEQVKVKFLGVWFDAI